MDLYTWLNYFYPQILADFGFDRENDVKATMLMLELGKDKLLDCSILKKVIYNKNVVVVGGAIDEFKPLKDWIIITAGKSILNLDFIPHIHVTDMEEDDDILIELERNGCLLVLHAHGDNIDRIKSVVPKLKRFIATTQSEPIHKVYNFGGFTDGDRAAIIAKVFGAKFIKLVGFDFERAQGLKLKKLQWAKRILEFEGVL
ncbi:MAG TPA: DUF115 domain-containing protein [Archaeoglobus profundus]|nr:DUF115 domain-containing protein [Archaeoglobus profundus]